MKITDLIIDPQSLGEKLWLVDIKPAYEYKDNRRTDNVLGYRYTVALPDKGLDKISVKIDGKQQLEVPDGFIEVAFTDLDIYIYWSGGQPQIGAKAKGISVIHKA